MQYSDVDTTREVFASPVNGNIDLGKITAFFDRRMDGSIPCHYTHWYGYLVLDREVTWRDVLPFLFIPVLLLCIDKVT